MLNLLHHDYPAIDLLVPAGSPIDAVRGGVVARVGKWPYNCCRFGACKETCCVGLSIDGDDGARWIYCHGTRLKGISVGDTVTARQLLMWSGDTSRSWEPHLHLEMRVDQRQVGPHALLTAVYTTGQGSPLDSLRPGAAASDFPSTNERALRSRNGTSPEMASHLMAAREEALQAVEIHKSSSVN